MTVDDAVATVLDRLSAAQVAAFAAACESLSRPAGRLASVIAGAPPGAADAVSSLLAAWQSCPNLTGAGLALALRLGLAARQRAEETGARPIWTGPGTIGQQRLTAGVLHELLAGARQRILLVSFAAHTLPELAADLEAAVDRGCRVDVVFETAEDSARAYSGPHRPFAHVTGINRWRWLREQRDSGGLLHAKLLVIDGQRAYVGSANLTAKALHDNLEVGVLIADPDIATQLERHILDLMSAGTLVKSR